MKKKYCIICEREITSRNQLRKKIENRITCSRKCSVVYHRVYIYFYRTFRSKLKKAKWDYSFLSLKPLNLSTSKKP